MAESNQTIVKRVGLNFLEALTIVFVVLKLTGYIDWGWWLVLLPFYGPFVLYWLVVFGVFLFGLLCLGVVRTAAYLFEKSEAKQLRQRREIIELALNKENKTYERR